MSQKSEVSASELIENISSKVLKSNATYFASATIEKAKITKSKNIFVVLILAMLVLVFILSNFKSNLYFLNKISFFCKTNETNVIWKV